MKHPYSIIQKTLVVSLGLFVASCGSAKQDFTIDSNDSTPIAKSNTDTSQGSVEPDILLEPKGEVSVLAFGGADWQVLDGETLIQEGDGIQTGKQSSATITFQDGSVARINSESTIYLMETGTVEKQDVSIQLVSGEVWNKVQNLVPGGGYEVSTDNTLAVVRGTEFDVVKDDDGSTEVATIESEVAVSTVENVDDLVGDEAEPIIVQRMLVGQGKSFKVSPEFIKTLRDHRADNLKAGVDIKQEMLFAMVPDDFQPDPERKAFIEDNAKLKIKKLQLTNEEKEKLKKIKRAADNLSPEAKDKILEQLKAGRLDPDKMKELYQHINENRDQFEDQPLMFLRELKEQKAVGDGALLKDSPDGAATQPKEDLSRASSVVGAVLRNADDPATMQRIASTTLTASERDALRRAGAYDTWLALKVAASNGNKEKVQVLANQLFNKLPK